MIDFTYDEERAQHVALWLLKRHGTLDHIKLLKLVLLADLEHLTRYGRPIVGGGYNAMENGPVNSELYDLLKLRLLPGTTAVNDFTIRAVEEPNEDFLSETDLEVLHDVNAAHGSWDRYRLSDLTHTLEAWKKNYEGRPKGSYPIPYEDLLNERAGAEVRSLVEENQLAEQVLG